MGRLAEGAASIWDAVRRVEAEEVRGPALQALFALEEGNDVEGGCATRRTVARVAGAISSEI